MVRAVPSDSVGTGHDGTGNLESDMGLREQFNEQMKEAMKAKDQRRLSTVRMILAGVSAEAFDKGGRPEMAKSEREEVDIIRTFMPKQMSADEQRAAIQKAITDVGAASMKDMGKIMAALKERYAGQMDFGKASGIVKELLK